MTGGSPAATVTEVEIRDSPLHRSFCDPKDREVRHATVRRMSGNCTTPVYLAYSGAVSDGQGGQWSANDRDRDHEIAVRCRNCPSCLRARRFQWGLRAHWECLTHPATWFFTGTFRSQTHDYQESKCEVQRFLKRLREREFAKTGERSIRYLMLPELHRSGAIHYHGLLHHSGDVTYRMVRDSWSAGFCYPSSVRNPEATAHYVTKYATKDMLGQSDSESGRSRRPRILASRNPTYGDPVIIRDAELVQELARANQETEVETWTKNLKQAIRTLKAQKEGAKSTHRLVVEAEAARALGAE
jgi:hypothetical protein